MPLDAFHPLIAGWFRERFAAPTDAQAQGWPEILAGRNTLLAAPTGSGKTLAAFLVCIDRLVRQGLAGELTDRTQVVYVSPLKALSNDVRRNLQRPLDEIAARAAATGLPLPPVRVALRTGDTPARERQAMLRRPPHILVTTPESLYLLLTSAKGRLILGDVRTVIVDEIHALARDKRGSHLALSLERLDALCAAAPPLRIGLSATQRPMDEMARFLVGARRVSPDGQPDCRIVDVGHARQLDLAIETPPSDLSAVCSNEQWDEVYARLGELIHSHRSTLVFVNTRRLAERVAHRLTEALGEEAVASHHGSLSKEIRLSAEERLQSGQLKAIVATASLELGIDVGFIDLVCQIGSPRSIATLLQRIGRSGHSLGALPKGRLFPLTRDELLECLALVRGVRGGRLDRIEMPVCPLDILAQQIVAETAAEEQREDELFARFRGAWPFRDLRREDFDAVVEMLSEGIARGKRHGAYLHRDRVNHRLRARRGARIAALTSGGAIPEVADYRVVTEDDRTFVGTVNEDFAIESLAGDVFLLGNTAWRIRYVRGGEVVVADAQGAPATIPFWLGEAPGRTIELSDEVSALREEIARRVQLTASSAETPTGEPGASAPGSVAADFSPANAGPADSDSAAIDDLGGFRFGTRSVPTTGPGAAAWLVAECGAGEHAARQAADYVAAQLAAVGLVPTRTRIVFERFFDDSGGMQLVIHSPLGARINRAWGLAMRKRFCRSFDFELQASADDNGIVLSLGPQHSFPLEQMFKMLNTGNAEHMLTQALLAVPLFQVRWRWNVTRALAVLRQRGGKKVPPALQRFRADDLLTAVFPAQTACFEHRPEDMEIPKHPLIDQTVRDCLHEATDLVRWLGVLAEMEAGRVEFVARDTREPSPFSYEILNANPYAFLDDAPLEERRARAVATRRTFSAETLGDLAWLDPAAIAQVRAEAWPVVRDADELHDALLQLAALPADEGAEWRGWFEELASQGRATTLRLDLSGATAVSAVRAAVSFPTSPEPRAYWVAAERLTLVQAALAGGTCDPPLALPPELQQPAERLEAIAALVRGRIEIGGPTTAETIAARLGLDEPMVSATLEALEGEGCVLRGRFTTNARPLDAAAVSPGATAVSAVRSGDQLPNSAGTRPAATEAVRHPDSTPPGSQSRGTQSSPSPIEWCDRRLLARIHRLTLDTARRGVEPASPADFLRFLAEHQHATTATRMERRAALREIVGQLQGFEMPAGAWERDVLPLRIADYDPAWLDELSLSGELAWGRLQPPPGDEEDGPHGAGLTRVAPLSLLARADLAWLLPPDRGRPEARARSNARTAYEALSEHGALFFHDLLAVTSLLPAQLEDALSELAALGVVTADGFSTIRTLVSPDRRRPDDARRRRGRRQRLVKAYARGGRWSRFPGAVKAAEPRERLDQWARQLLKRYGVVFRDLLARESCAPPWRELAGLFRRWEAQGTIRGGRFVSGVAGEQFALPEAVTHLRKKREEGPTGEWLVVSASDPINLAGVVTKEPRVPAIASHRLALRDGRLVASLQAGELHFHAQLPVYVAEEIARALRIDAAARVEKEADVLSLPRLAPTAAAATQRTAHG